MARFVQYRQFGGPEVLEIVEGDIPHAGIGEVVVELKAAGVNPIDAKLRSGARTSAPIESPRVPGTDAAGIIVEVGPDVTGWQVGDEVIVAGARGAYASHTVVAATGLARKPGALSWVQAAGIGVPAGTAFQALRSLEVGEGTTLLLHAASGAVGQAALQFAREFGATVIGTGSSANHDRIRQLGGTPVEYGPGLVDRVRALAPQGIDRALDAAGTDEAIEASLELVDDPQHIGTIVRGADAPRWGIRAWSGGSAVPLTPEEKAWRTEGVRRAAELAAEGRYDVEIARTLPLDQAAEAQRLIERGGLRGKIVLLP
jgi:NADPH:quinone reductase-like Zn-dependent oxidoreductase